MKIGVEVFLIGMGAASIRSPANQSFGALFLSFATRRVAQSIS